MSSYLPSVLTNYDSCQGPGFRPQNIAGREERERAMVPNTSQYLHVHHTFIMQGEFGNADTAHMQKKNGRCKSHHWCHYTDIIMILSAALLLDGGVLVLPCLSSCSILSLCVSSHASVRDGLRTLYQDVRKS